MQTQTAGLRGVWPSVRRWMSRMRPPSAFAGEPARTLGRRAGDQASRLAQGKEPAAPAAGELWARVQCTEKEHQASLARYEAFGVLDPSSEWTPQYEQAGRSADLAWVRAEEARHELDAFLHPKRYAGKGYAAEALDEFRAQAKADEPEIEPFG